jgi:alkylation response protein AidB-like acyl-CoA dehydrogenase
VQLQIWGCNQMILNEPDRGNLLNQIIHRKLKPLVRKIDAEAYYPLDYLTELGKAGLLPSQHKTEMEILTDGVFLVEETARTCMTTAFNLWCHLTASAYLRKSDNEFLRSQVLPLLENGSMLGGTGLSNPMKYYSGLENLCLKARRSGSGYIISGKLPNVSNLGPGHGFGIIASVDEYNRIMAFVQCSSKGLSLKEKINYIGLNGSATYMCEFDEVFVPNNWIISEHADEFVTGIRSQFLLYQIPLGLGVTSAAIRSMDKTKYKQAGSSRYLKDRPDLLERDLLPLREATYLLAAQNIHDLKWHDTVQVRLEVSYLTLRAVQAGMLHSGGAGYLQYSNESRRLREAYFLANLTPTIKHLEKIHDLH